MNKALQTWLLLFFLLLLFTSFCARAESPYAQEHMSDPAVTEMKLISFKGLMGRVITYSRDASKVHQTPNTQTLLTLELFSEKQSNRKPDIKHLSFNDLASSFSYATAISSQIQTVIKDIKLHNKSREVQLYLSVEGINPAGMSVPYAQLDCKVRIRKNKWGKFTCQLTDHRNKYADY